MSLKDVIWPLAVCNHGFIKFECPQAAEARLAAAEKRAAEALSARAVGLTPLMTLLNITPRTSETGGCSNATAIEEVWLVATCMPLPRNIPIQ